MSDSLGELKKKINAFKQALEVCLEKGGELESCIGRADLSKDRDHLQSMRRRVSRFSQMGKSEVKVSLEKSLSKLASREVESHTGSHRVYPRYVHRWAVQYGLPGQGKIHKGFTHDIGAMGLFLMSNRQESLGQQIYLDVVVPELGVVQLQGTVVWRKWVPPALRSLEYTGFGVKIINAPESWFTYFAKQETK